MKTQVMKAPRADEKQRARAEMGGGWAGGGGKEGSREEFKRGNLRHPELINAEGEGGGRQGCTTGHATVAPVLEDMAPVTKAEHKEGGMAGWCFCCTMGEYDMRRTRVGHLV